MVVFTGPEGGPRTLGSPVPGILRMVGIVYVITEDTLNHVKSRRI